MATNPSANLSSKVVTGARLKVAIFDAAGNGGVVGIFNHVSWGFQLDAQPIYILGAFAPCEIDYTAQEPCRITCTGWRIVGAGPHAVAKVPHVQDLLNSQYIQLTIVDRQTNTTIAAIKDVRAVSYDTSAQARNPEEVTITFIGRIVEDESGDNVEGGTASVLP